MRGFSATEVAAYAAAIDALANRPPEIGRQMVYFDVPRVEQDVIAT